MSTPRFYSHIEIPPYGIFRLPDAAAHHASRVLRLEEGDEIVLFDGTGGESRCRIADVSKSCVLAEIVEKTAIDREAKLAVILVQALAATEKMDWVLQKAVELGVKCIQIVETKRSVVKLSVERAKKREAHWNSVAISACEQCGRNRIPEIPSIVPLQEWLSVQRSGTKFLLSPSGKPLKDFPVPDSEIFLLVGPEGGLSPEEEALARARGFEALGLGPRILRTETAGLAALSALHALWGDFN
ncbi:MAG: 16S rRNA (uracil(1498)-N(3))-methyltransferase [Burkholderiales bacterium]|nr:16S rRNA (uracil(1498)-N(3))-methyltransferase [Burkholderiales bacterium]